VDFQTLKYEENDGVGVLKIQRPEALNALNRLVVEELHSFFDQSPQGLRCLIITGEGKAFVAGADIKEFVELDSTRAEELSAQGQKLMGRIENYHVPVIAAVNGFALGGGFELALACDFIIASEKAKMGLPEVSLGLIPGYGGTQRLARNVGRSLARALTLTGEIFSAQELLTWGLIFKVVTPESLMAEAHTWASKISQRGPVALQLAKASINKGYDLELEDGLKLEARGFGECFKTNDQSEGVKAFIEKRSPQFKGQ